MLIEGEVVLTCVLRGDGYEEGSASAELRVKVTPGFEFGDAIGIPAPAEEFDDQRAEGEQIDGVDGLAGEGVLKCEGGGMAPDLRTRSSMPVAKSSAIAVFGDIEALGLDKGSGVLGDAIELILERDVERGGHESIIAASLWVDC